MVCRSRRSPPIIMIERSKQYGNPRLYRQFDQRAGTDSPRRGGRGTYAPGGYPRAPPLCHDADAELTATVNLGCPYQSSAYRPRGGLGSISWWSYLKDRGGIK